MLEAGSKAPAFSLPDQNGKTVSLSDFTGEKVVLYFYPRDNTPGCTKEACSFRDYYKDIKKKGAVILGVSKDSSKTHENFIEQNNLPFTLLTDEGNEVGKLYGAFGERSMYGKKYMGTIRSTFVIDEKGNIEKVFPKVKPNEHGAEVLKYLEQE